MTGDIRKLNVIVLLFVILSVLIVLMISSPVEVSRLYVAGQEDEYLIATDFKGVAEPVVIDAKNRAKGLYGSNEEAVEELTAQLLGAYKASVKVDTIIIFNSGGFGWSPVEASPGWSTLMEGIAEEVAGLGRDVKIMDYYRTKPGISGVVDEVAAFWGLNPLKSDELALRVDFLTKHLTDMRVILAGESNGSGIVEDAMQKLKENRQVIGIQTGPMMVQRSEPFERSLVTRHNGERQDSLSKGDFFTIIRANFEEIMGIEQECMGEALFYIGAPGHHYTWETEALRQKIAGFLHGNLA